MNHDNHHDEKRGPGRRKTILLENIPLRKTGHNFKYISTIFIYLFIYLFIYSFIYIFIYLSIYLSRIF